MPGSLLTGPVRLAGASLLRLQSDERLVALARAGHQEACAAIVARHRPPLLRYCARIVGPARAEDAVQQTFISAFASMSESEREIELRPWLYRIAHNAALRLLRAGAESEPLSEYAAAARTDEAAELRDRLQRTLAAIEQLPQPQRDAVLLQALEGRSHTQIAAALGMTPGAARQQLHRARATLRAAVTAVTPLPLLGRLLATSGGLAMNLVAGGAATVALVVGAAAGAGGLPGRDDPPRHVEPSSTAAGTAVRDGSSPAVVPARAASTSPVASGPREPAGRRERRQRPRRVTSPRPAGFTPAPIPPPFIASREPAQAERPAAARPQRPSAVPRPPRDARSRRAKQRGHRAASQPPRPPQPHRPATPHPASPRPPQPHRRTDHASPAHARAATARDADPGADSARPGAA